VYGQYKPGKIFEKENTKWDNSNWLPILAGRTNEMFDPKVESNCTYRDAIQSERRARTRHFHCESNENDKWKKENARLVGEHSAESGYPIAAKEKGALFFEKQLGQ
jgi:hypothetical protein